ncbi:hypothetical protein TRVL_00748 [Trypanosoma vivax]|uniref:Uncharacterized protein n=1 Tax=Trypanosoma vivax (strain Y486) TaxID=1055687 RepID=G0U1H1_TRYVY|nr:hypothetical protein TRVL_00748 [Trypanosoma vivax]CCC49927.1 conserved hypothetical protein [Trypanosoma vivax Y486]
MLLFLFEELREACYCHRCGAGFTARTAARPQDVDKRVSIFLPPLMLTLKVLKRPRASLFCFLFVGSRLSCYLFACPTEILFIDALHCLFHLLLLLFSLFSQCVDSMGDKHALNDKPRFSTSGRLHARRFRLRRQLNGASGQRTSHMSAMRRKSHRFHVRRPERKKGTIPAAFVSPFQATRSQCGQHSASVVRTNVTGPSQQQILFYSSVQRRGGAFTTTAQETKAQLARTGVLPNSTAFRKRARSAAEAQSGKPQSMYERFATMQSEKAEADLRQARELVKKTGGNRFCDDCDSESDAE